MTGNTGFLMWPATVSTMRLPLTVHTWPRPSSRERAHQLAGPSAWAGYAGLLFEPAPCRLPKGEWEWPSMPPVIKGNSKRFNGLSSRAKSKMAQWPIYAEGF